jgi:PhnB protein
MTQAIPNEYPGLIPYLSIQGAAQALDFYRRAFGAEVAYRINGPEGRLGHAELRVGKACFMLADPCEANSQMASAPEHSSAISLYLYVEDVDTCFAQALAAGAEQLMEPQDMFYGDRSGMLRDPYGFVWNLASHVEDVAPDELERRAAQMFAQPPAGTP